MDRSGLDPRALAHLQHQEALNKPPLNTCRAEDVREDINRDFLDFVSRPEPVEKVEEIPVTGYRDRIRLRAYIPGGRKPLPVLFYIHGGGWVLCSLDTHDSLCRQIANLVPCVVLSVDYHVAPEHKFPEPLEDCWAAFEWARSHAADLGGDPRRIAVGGDSAGGKLSAALTLVARD